METIPVKNLAHLKKLLHKGAQYRAIYHSVHPEYVGLIREVTTVQTNAVYSKIKGQPQHDLSICNYGKGVRTEFEKANRYIFGDTVKILDKDCKKVMYEFEMLKNV